MSDPVKELAKTCEIIGKECKDLVQEHDNKKIDELTFMREYFNILEKMPEGEKKEKVLKELDTFKTAQEEVSFRDKPTESEIKSE